MPDFTLDQEQYEALVSMARRGAIDPSNLSELELWLRKIESANGVERDFVLVQWQETSAPLPPGTRFPEVWPPELRETIELVTRKIARADVDAMLKTKAVNPTSVLVTRDTAGLVGWTTLDEFFR